MSSNLPTTGTATYQGTVSGTFQNLRTINGAETIVNSGSFTGTATYTPDFANNSSSGGFDKLTDTKTRQPITTLTGGLIEGLGDPGYIERAASPPTLSGSMNGQVIALGNGNSEVVWRSVNAKFIGADGKNLHGEMQATFHEYSPDHSTDVTTKLTGTFTAKCLRPSPP